MIWRVAALGLLMAFVGIILGELGFKGKRVFGALCITVLLGAVLEGAVQMLSSVMKIAVSGGVGETARAAVKVVCTGYIFGFVSDIAEELGERGIASAVTAVGRVEIFLIIFPFFTEILEMGMNLIEG